MIAPHKMKVEVGRRDEFGSCNNCQTRLSPIIYALHLKTLVVLLCPKCLPEAVTDLMCAFTGLDLA